jgi:maleylacetoacetate isomerase
MASDVVLYSYFRSSAAYRVRIALHLKNIPHEYRAIHLLNSGGEQNKQDYLKVNPMGEVPCLVHKDQPIGQSMAIVEYLDAIWPVPPLFPKDPYRAALVRQLCENINAGIHPIQNLKVLQELERRFSVDQDVKNDWAAYWIARGFIGVERMLEKTAGRYCVGNEITAADLFLVPQVVNAKRYNVDMGAFPRIQKVNDECMKLTAFIKAGPKEQPDTPADQK